MPRPSSPLIDAATVRRITTGAEPVLHRSGKTVTCLHFAEPFGRFLALKVYPLEFFPDSSFITQFQTNATSLRESFTGLVPFPIEVGYDHARLYQLSTLLPGLPLKSLLREPSQLHDQDRFRLAAATLASARSVLNRHRLVPSLDPAQIVISSGPGGRPEVAFSDCDLRPDRLALGASLVLHLLDEMRRLCFFLGSGTEVTTEELDEKLAHPLSFAAEAGPAMADLLRRLEADSGLADTARLDRMAHFLEARAGSAPLPLEGLRLDPDHPFLAWMPPLSALPDRYAYGNSRSAEGMPHSFDAEDRFLSGSRLVHLLPPTPARSRTLGPLLDQANALAHTHSLPGFTELESVMSDPRCHLIAERPHHGISLRELIDRRGGTLPAAEALHILSHLDSTLRDLEKADAHIPEILPCDVIIEWHLTGPETLACHFDRQHFRCHEPEHFRVRIRPVPTNLLDREPPNLARLILPLDPQARARAAQNAFHPGFHFSRLALQLLAQTREFSETGLPIPGTPFARAFTSRSMDSVSNRRALLRSLRAHLEVTLRDTSPAPLSIRAIRFLTLQRWVAPQGVAAAATVLALSGIALAAAFGNWIPGGRLSDIPEPLAAQVPRSPGDALRAPSNLLQTAGTSKSPASTEVRPALLEFTRR